MPHSPPSKDQAPLLQAIAGVLQALQQPPLEGLGQGASQQLSQYPTLQELFRVWQTVAPYAVPGGAAAMAPLAGSVMDIRDLKNLMGPLTMTKGPKASIPLGGGPVPASTQEAAVWLQALLRGAGKGAVQ